jgi:hypothetical protein
VSDVEVALFSLSRVGEGRGEGRPVPEKALLTTFLRDRKAHASF